MRKSFLKGFTPLTIILLVGTTVGVAITAFYSVSSLTQKTQEETSSYAEHQFEVMNTKLKIESFSNCKIYLRNTGTTNIPISAINFYVDNKPITPLSSTGVIKKGEIQEINFSGLSPKKYKLVVKVYGNTMDYGYMTCQVAFSCAIRTNCESNETEILALSAQNNAFAELPGGNYTHKLCCSGISSVNTTIGKGTCGSGFTGLVTLSADTNAFAEKYDLSSSELPAGCEPFDYKKNICIQLASGSLECSYGNITQCNSGGYTELILSLSSKTNAFIGNSSSYPDLILCCKEQI